MINRLLLVALAVNARYRVLRNTTNPAHQTELICDSGKFYGDAKLEDLSDEDCQIICRDDCHHYSTTSDIAKCLSDREALNCFYQYYHAYDVRASFCEDSIQGYYNIQLPNDPYIGVHASSSQKAVVWLELQLYTNDENPGNRDCVSGAPAVVAWYPNSTLHWNANDNTCVAQEGGVENVHYDAGLSIMGNPLKFEMVRHDFSWTISADVTELIGTAGNLIEGGGMMQVVSQTCFGSARRWPGLAGVMLYRKEALTDFSGKIE